MVVLEADFADVVQEGSDRQRLLFGERQVEAIGEQRRIETDAAAMIQQLPVFGFQKI